MGAVADAFNTAFRAYVVDGVPASGVNPPDKGDARALGALIEETVGPADEIVTITGDTTLTLDHRGVWMEVSKASAVTITIPPDADVAFPVPSNIYGAQAGVGAVNFAAGAGVTLLVATNQDTTTAAQGAVWQLRKIDTNVWRAFGNLVAV